MTKLDKRKFVERLAEEAEEAADRQDLKTLNRISTIPEAWKTGLIVKLPKKGDLGNCDNWRGVILLPITSKVFSKIIHTRLAEAVDEYIRQEQAGFHPGCSCSDHIFTLRQILEQSKEWNAPCMPNLLTLRRRLTAFTEIPCGRY